MASDNGLCLLNPAPSQIRRPNRRAAPQVVSQPPAPASGRVHRYPTLAAIQGAVFEERAVVLADALGGDEDIPAGVTAGARARGRKMKKAGRL